MTLMTMTCVSALALSGGRAKKLNPRMSQGPAAEEPMKLESTTASLVQCISSLRACMSSKELSDDMYIFRWRAQWLEAGHEAEKA